MDYSVNVFRRTKGYCVYYNSLKEEGYFTYKGLYIKIVEREE